MDAGTVAVSTVISINASMFERLQQMTRMAIHPALATINKTDNDCGKQQWLQ